MVGRRSTLSHALIATLILATVPLDAQRPPGPQPGLRLPVIFGDGVVLQRGKPITIWGWATPTAPVDVAFRGRRAATTADTVGAWRVVLPGGPAGGPFILSVTSGADRVDRGDVLVGDVWLASGQSNMEFRLADSRDAAPEIARAHDMRLREFKIPNSWSTSPEDELTGGSWAPADSSHAGSFSGVAYYFARALRRSTGVPIGIVNSTWGGSNIETWMSRAANGLSDSAWAAQLRTRREQDEAIQRALRAKLGELPQEDHGLVNGRAVWAAPDLDDSAWSSIPVPSYWESNGYEGMDGVAWYRLTFDVPPSAMHGDARLTIGAIDDDDMAWVNGIRVGETKGYNYARSYRVPNSALREGANVLAVRVVDYGGGGGINDSVAIAFADGSRQSLNGTWKFRVAAVSFQADGQKINKIPTVLYNRMIHPILPFAIKGVIWYQGESNANNAPQAAAYRGQFASLIRSWRREFAERDTFPFLWVQLPNFGKPDSEPPTVAQSAWAVQRESMTAALALPRTGQAITIDVGEGLLHPLDKRDPGERLARVARRVVYGEPVVASGPTYRSSVTRGDTVIVTFANANGLTARDGGRRGVGGFAIAGSDQRFVWAEARIVGQNVKVWSPRVAHPVALRYAWATNPERANLYSASGLPAAPFRTDRW
jgi:sialate O-acetylesterase